jgi:hypothetical protein
VDGGFGSFGFVAYDSARDAIYVTDGNGRLSKITASTGAYVGAVGVTTATTGSCPASGVTAGWCTGGTFSAASGDGQFGFFGASIAYDATNDALYIADFNGSRVNKVTAGTGVFVGSIGRVNTSTGTCVAGTVATSWCTGGSFTLGSGDGTYFNTSGIAYDPVNNVILLSMFASITKISPTGAFIGSLGLSNSSTGTCTSSSVPNRSWCTGGSFATSGSREGSFNNPSGIAVNSTLKVMYIGDKLNHRIQAVPLN